MSKLSEGEKVKKRLLELIGASRSQGDLNNVMNSNSYARLLHTLFEDRSELSTSACGMAKAYRQIGCTDRAIHHGLVAARATDLKPQLKLEASIVIAKCCTQQGNLDEARDRLDELLLLLRGQKKEHTGLLLEVEAMMVECLSKQGKLQQALEEHDTLMKLCSSLYGVNSVEYALGLVEKGKLCAGLMLNELAEQHQQKAIDTLIMLSFNKVDIVPDLYVTLASYQRQNGNLQTEYSSLVKARNIYNELLAGNSCKLIEVRRSIATNLEAQGRHYECLKEWIDIRQMEKLAYGEITTQVGKTERVIGRLYSQLGKYVQGNIGTNLAIKHYLRAASIFEENGERKSCWEVEQAVRELRERRPGCRLRSANQQIRG